VSAVKIFPEFQLVVPKSASRISNTGSFIFSYQSHARPSHCGQYQINAPRAVRMTSRLAKQILDYYPKNLVRSDFAEILSVADEK
jgi:hypothetical protein